MAALILRVHKTDDGGRIGWSRLGAAHQDQIGRADWFWPWKEILIGFRHVDDMWWR